MKKIIISLAALAAAGLVVWGAFALGTNHDSSKSDDSSSSSKVVSSKKTKKSTSSSASSSASSSSSASAQSSTASSSSSEKHTAFGGQGAAQPSTPSQDQVNDATTQLRNAGFPVDQWAPSDIEKIVSEAKQQGVSVVDYAKQNYHQ